MTQPNAMSLPRALRVLLTVVIFTVGFGPTPRAQTGTAMTNQDVVNMVSAGLGEQVILNAVRQAPRRNFDLSPGALIDLKKKGVPDSIITEMQKGTAPAAASGSATVQQVTGSISREQAVEIIGRSNLFTTPDTITVQQGLSCSAGPDPFAPAPGETDINYFNRMQAEILNPSIPQDRAKTIAGWEALRSAGLLRIEPSAGCGVDRQLGPLRGTVILLSPEGNAASKQWRQVDAKTWEVPMGRRSVVAVTGIKGDAQAAVAEFSWRWTALQAGVDAGPRVMTAQAVFEKYDDGWRLNVTRLRDYFFDGFGRLMAPPVYGISTTPPPTALVEVPREPAAALGLAREALQKKDYATAIRITTDLLKNNAGDINGTKSVLGAALFESGKYAEGATNLRTVLDAGQPIELHVKHIHKVSSGLPFLSNDTFCTGTLTITKDRLKFVGGRGGDQDAFDVERSGIASIRRQPGPVAGEEVRIEVLTTKNNKPAKVEYQFSPLQAITRPVDPNSPNDMIRAYCECAGGADGLSVLLTQFVPAKK